MRKKLLFMLFCHNLICADEFIIPQDLYRNNMKNRFLALSGVPHNFHSHSRLASGNGRSLRGENSEDPPCQISDSSSCFGINEGSLIEQIILISDVDGVIRHSVDACADPRVIKAIKKLLEHNDVDVTFISGTPVESSGNHCNVPLNQAFGAAFEKELGEGRVSIFGVLGSQRMLSDGSAEIVDEFPQETILELRTLLIKAFLNEIEMHGTTQQKLLAETLKTEPLDEVIGLIQEHIDPHFRLISSHSSVETHTSSPPWSTTLSVEWLKSECSEKNIAAGFAHKGENGFNFLLISKTNKGLTTKKLIEEKIRQYPKALIVTIGDTQVDFPMHRNAHLAFHVGLKTVWDNHPLPQCFMVCGPEGQDSQHVEGTLQVLELLQKAIGHPFEEFIPKKCVNGFMRY